MLASLKPDHFTDDDVPFAEAVARWTAAVAHRAELVEDITRNAAAQGRQGAAEELVTVLAHDLRNLMAPLDTRLHLLQRRAEAEGRHADVADVQGAQQALARVRTLVSDILDVARIEKGLLAISCQLKTEGGRQSGRSALKLCFLTAFRLPLTAYRLPLTAH